MKKCLLLHLSVESVVDYLAEILRHLRNEDFSQIFQHAGFMISNQMSTRDREAINKTMSGFLKLIFPDGGANADELEELLFLAVKSRKRVKDQLKRIDNTYPETDFYFVGPDEKKCLVTTLEEDEYPSFYFKSRAVDPEGDACDAEGAKDKAAETINPAVAKETGLAEVDASRAGPLEGHLVYREDRKGVTFENLFGS